MPRKLIAPKEQFSDAKRDLAERLAEELGSDREAGQPVIYERVFGTGKASVNVIWDAWDGLSLQKRSATIHRAYELAEGAAARDRVALASGLTVAEAHAAGMLPFQIVPAVRKSDPLTPEQATQALLDEGASRLGPSGAVQLRFANPEEAEAARQRLLRRFPGTEEVWLILADAQEFVSDED